MQETQGTIDASDGHPGAASPSEPWIRALHDHLLGRAPEPRELARWADTARRCASHRELADRFLRSRDYCGRQVEALYRDLLGRDGEPELVRAWTESLRSGAAIQDVITGLCDSFEYRAQHPPPEPFVDSLYRRLLHREPDAEGKAGWLRALGERASTLSVVQEFVRSTEFCTRRLTELHLRLLGREPDPPGLLRWIVAAAQGTGLQHFALEIVTSSEYILRADRRDPGPPAVPGDDALALGGAPAGARPPGKPAQYLIRFLIQRHATAEFRPCDDALTTGDRPAAPTPAVCTR